jgi:predicted kinase
MNAHEELNLPVAHVARICDKKATIIIAYNLKIDDQSNYIDIAYHLVNENI